LRCAVDQPRAQMRHMFGGLTQRRRALLDVGSHLIRAIWTACEFDCLAQEELHSFDDGRDWIAASDSAQQAVAFKRLRRQLHADLTALSKTN
jgi:hypothetical protein